MDPAIADLVALSVVIAIGFLIAVAFYESLSTRDVLTARTMRFARRHSTRSWVVGTTYGATVLIGIPVLVVVWTVILELGLVVVSSADRIGSVALVAVAIVGAARILAYIREKTSHELAKAIPLSLAFVLLTGGATHLQANLESLLTDPRGSALTTEMVVFLVGLEIGLRLLTDGSHAVLSAIQSRRGVDSDLGVWRTLARSLRRPVAVSSGGDLPAPASDGGE